LDLDGDGYTVRDRLGGVMNQGWRLNLASGVLGRVAIDGEDQLVTERDGSTGFAVRKSNLDITAEWRGEGSLGQFGAVGWSEDVHSLDATVQLPAGWTIFGSSGVDELRGTWLSQWDLFAFFFVLVVSVAVGRLVSVGWGLVALLVAVFPANLHMALHPELFSDASPFALYSRLPIQLLLIAWAYWATRADSDPTDSSKVIPESAQN